MNSMAHELTDTELDCVTGGSSLMMLSLQSLMSQRQSAIHLITNVMSSMSRSTSSIARKIG